MSTKADIAAAYAMDCCSPVQVPNWAHLPHHVSASGRLKADGWGIEIHTPTYVGPERRREVREPVLRAHGSRVLPKQAGWLFAARGK